VSKPLAEVGKTKEPSYGTEDNDTSSAGGVGGRPLLKREKGRDKQQRKRRLSGADHPHEQGSDLISPHLNSRMSPQLPHQEFNKGQQQQQQKGNGPTEFGTGSVFFDTPEVSVEEPVRYAARLLKYMDAIIS
jgi:hypothetical protein